jgi:hypothetical protein
VKKANDLEVALFIRVVKAGSRGACMEQILSRKESKPVTCPQKTRKKPRKPLSFLNPHKDFN